MREATKRPLQWPGFSEELAQLSAFKDSIKRFKKTTSLAVLQNFYSDDKEFKDSQGESLGRLPCFPPQQTNREGRRNWGIFSTALCLEVIGSYSEEMSAADRKDPWTGATTSARDKYLRFILKGLAKDLQLSDTNRVIELGALPQVAALVKLHGFLTSWRWEEQDLREVDLWNASKFPQDLRSTLLDLLHGAVGDIGKAFEAKKETVHPFALYKFLLFLDAWQGTLIESYGRLDEAGRATALKCVPEAGMRAELERAIASDLAKGAVPAPAPEAIISNMRNGFQATPSSNLFEYFFERIYFWAKYELYRQLSLKLSNDLVLYDPKRLAYSLLIVSHRDRFSNHLIRERALNALFEPQLEHGNELWPTGQLLPMSEDSVMAVSDIEVANDLLHSETLFYQLPKYYRALKSIYDFYARTMQIRNDAIEGWYPPDQRDKTPQSYTTAHVLSFVKRFCQLLSLKISNTVKGHFQFNWKDPGLAWSEVLDCTAAKLKLELISESVKNREKSFRSAILFGPPGTGKTTLARAMASRLGMDYLELTPGDFFAGGEDQILQRINANFEHMLHLQRTVVFIDEIDDLVRRRGDGAGASPFDPRELYVNTLLPRFQELRDKAEVVLLLGTNHFERVDPAISRLGRIDLLIPVGALSPFGRTVLLDREVGGLTKWVENLKFKPEEVLGDYLEATEGASFSELRVMLRGIRSEVKREEPEEALRKALRQIKQLLAKRKADMERFYQDLESAGARPKYHRGDTDDFNTLGGGGGKVLNLFRSLLDQNEIPTPRKVRTTLKALRNDMRFNILGGVVDVLEGLAEREGAHSALHREVGEIRKLQMSRSFI